MSNTTRSESLYERARQLMPAGVNSPVRAFRAVGGSPRYIASANGACMRDADGNEFVDYVCSWGAIILGHADPEVTEAIHQAAMKGASYGAPHEGEILLAEEVQKAMPGMEMLRFVNSGTEATMSAIRVARGATGRPKVIKFDGCYHGHADGLLARAGSGVATFSLPDSAGVPAAFAEQTLIAPYNNLVAVEALFEANAGQVACVIVEPVAGNMGVVPPAEGFLDGLRDITRRHGALLILDEVMTGFRVAHGGATARFNADPDLICTGKVIGGGLPVGAYGGRKEIMSLVAPVGPVYQAGTLSGNPLAMAAGLAVLRRLNADLYSRQEALGQILDAGLLEAVTGAGVPAQIHRVGSMLTVFFTDQAVVDMDTAGSTDRALYGKVFHGMLERGFYLPPSALEAWFFSAAHTEQQVRATVAAFADSLREAVA